MRPSIYEGMLLMTEESFWDEVWKKHLRSYLDSPPRAGIFIASYFKKLGIKTILEIGGGSCRDSIYLANKGYSVVCSDFNRRLIDYLRKRFSRPNLRYLQENAFKLSFHDNSFDLVFHNGLFIYYNNKDIVKMLKEQERVSKKYIVIFVHNAANKKLVTKFKKLAKNDKLYSIRFFNKNELVSIIQQSGIEYEEIKILKFGGIWDALYHRKIKGLPNPLYRFGEVIVPRMYQLQPWQKTERIVCIVRLRK